MRASKFVRASKFAVLVALPLSTLVGCSGVPREPMHEPQSYTSMSCPELQAERQAVSNNESTERSNSTPDFLQTFGALTQGLAAGSGNAASAMQLASANDMIQTDKNNSKANADAYSARTDLLDKLIGARHCQ